MRSILVDRHPRPVDALATATARVVPVAACACERFHLRSLPSAGIARLPRYRNTLQGARRGGSSTSTPNSRLRDQPKARRQRGLVACTARIGRESDVELNDQGSTGAPRALRPRFVDAQWRGPLSGALGDQGRAAFVVSANVTSLFPSGVMKKM